MPQTSRTDGSEFSAPLQRPLNPQISLSAWAKSGLGRRWIGQHVPTSQNVPTSMRSWYRIAFTLLGSGIPAAAFSDCGALC